MINRPIHGLPGICVRWAVFSMIMLVFSVTGSTAQSQDEDSGSGSRQFRNEALQSIPFQQLNQQTKEKITDVLQRPSIYRRLPVTSIQTDPDHFRFLVRYPEVIVNIWQLMGVTQMTTERTGPFTMDTNDGAGTISSLELIYGNKNLHIFYGTGTYEGPVIRRQLTGRCVLVLRTDYSTGINGRPQANNQLDVFLKVDNATLGLIAKSISPIVGSTADHNFVESLKFVERLNETTEKNGPGVQHMATRLNLNDDIKEKYIELAGVVFERSTQGARAHTMIPTSVPMSVEPSPLPAPARRMGQEHRAPHYSQPAQSYPGFHPQVRPQFSTPTGLNGQSSQREIPPIIQSSSNSARSYGRPHHDAGGYYHGYRQASRPTGYQAPNYGQPGIYDQIPVYR